MPIRFQVDPDFYDHPKVTGMTDAAFSLWVRAGSYSAAKLTDGFIAEHVLVHTLRSSTDVAGELAHRGLWRRVKGGYQFHEWGLRNLTKQRVEDEKEADRERKRREREAARKAAGQNGNAQGKQGNVQTDSGQTPSGVPPDSGGNPPVSVSVLVSGSVSGSGRGSPHSPTSLPDLGPQPPPRCPKHLDDPTDDPCRACKGARQIHEAWERERVSRDAMARSAAAKDRAIASRAEIDACSSCDETGYRNGRLCRHPAHIPASERKPA